MSGTVAERISALTEELATTLGRRVDRIVGELSDGADFETIQSPGAELVATITAFKRIAEELEVVQAEAAAVHAAMLQLEARGASDDIVAAAEAKAIAHFARRDELIANLERLNAGIKSARRRAR